MEIDQHVDDISATLREKLLPGFAEYGLTIPQFYVTHIVLPEDDPNFKRIRELHTVMLQTRMYQAEATVKTVQAQSEASYRTAQEESKAAITAAQRKVVLEQQTTETELARREAERKLIHAQADAEARRLEGAGEADVTRMTGLSEAEVMRAKGYTQRDVLEADVKKAYAAGLGQMGSNGGGSALGDIAGLGVTLGAMGGVINMTKGAVAPMFEQSSPAASAGSGWGLPRLRQKGYHLQLLPRLRREEAGSKLWLGLPKLRDKEHSLKFLPELRCEKARPDMDMPGLRNDRHQEQFLPQLRQEEGGLSHD